MNFKKIDVLLGMKNIERLSNVPHHRGYNLLEHGLVTGMLFRWFASQEDVAYDINVFDKVLLHDYVESVTGDLNYLVKHHNQTTKEAWDVVEKEVCGDSVVLRDYTDKEIEKQLTPMQFKLFKICDYLDLWIFCKQEYALGNRCRSLLECIHNCEIMIWDITGGFTKFKSVKQFMDQYEG